jgi:predicted Fe-Mo cluster-binding NifX family protein
MNSGFQKCAVPTFGQYVAPRYDVAALFRLYELRDGQLVQAGTLNASGLDSESRLALLKGAGVDVVLCGGIRRFDLLRLHSAGIRVFPRVRGTVDAVVTAWANGNLGPGRPGWGRGRGPWGRGNRGKW